MIENQLKEKQKKFCNEYIIDFNGTQAAIRAGYSKKTSGQIAEQNLKKLEIQEYVQQLIKKQQTRTEITADKVLQELALIAFFDVAELYNKDGTLRPIVELSEGITRAVHSIKNRIEKQGQEKNDWAEIKEVKMHDKLKALELLGKRFSMFTDRIMYSGEVDINATIKTIDDFYENE